MRSDGAIKVKDILFSFNGRISRVTFILYGIGTYLLLFILLLAPIPIIARTNPETVSQFLIYQVPIILAQMFIWLWIQLAICYKRFQDCGRSGRFSVFPAILGAGYYFLAWIIPTTDTNDPNNPYLLVMGGCFLMAMVAFPLMLAYLAFTEGTDGPNQYGPLP